MKNPTLFANNITKEQALEVMDYIYCEYVDYISTTPDDKIMWFYNDEMIAKWTNEYRNIMISKDFVDFVSAERDYHLEKFPK